MLRKHIGDTTERIITPLAAWLVSKHITPNMLTLTGLAINTIAALFFMGGMFVAGGWIMLVAGLFDMLDGAVARASNTVSNFGAFTDSVVDRYSDFILLSGILLFFFKHQHFGGLLLVLATICGSYMVSYTRARAELVIEKCAVGFLERPERILLLAAGTISPYLFPCLWILAIGTNATALYRMYYTKKQSQQTPSL